MVIFNEFYSDQGNIKEKLYLWYIIPQQQGKNISSLTLSPTAPLYLTVLG
jgi:hypothetical protein